MHSDLQSELRRFDPKLPIEKAATPPASWYLDPRFLALEKDTVFKKTWQPVGRIDQLQKPGDYFSGDLLGVPYAVVRDGEGKIRAFHNTCRHHAAEILKGHGCVKDLICPYHGWTYGLDG